MSEYQPKTGQACHCRPGQQRDNCPDCEGTGQRVDFRAIRAQRTEVSHTPGPWEVAKDATPEWHAQFTVYAQDTGERVATVFLTKANADLIAQAPDLLAEVARLRAVNEELVAALDSTAKALEGWMDIADDEDVRDYDWTALSSARAVLAKARQ